MKNILLISSEFPPGPGGIGRHALDLSLALANEGFSILVFSPIDYTKGPTLNNFLTDLPPSIQLRILKRSGWRTHIDRISVIFKALSKEHTRIVVTGTFPLWIGALIKFIYGKRKHVDFFLHGSEVRPNKLFRRLFTRWSLSFADIIWAVSSFTAMLLPSSIRKKKRIEILPNGFHVKEWSKYKFSVAGDRWPGYPKLLTVGNITQRKGQHRVIAALPEILKDYPEAHYHMVGLPTDATQITRLAERLGVQEHITIHGKVDGKHELAEAYQASDIFLMLSENQPNGDVEGFGISILEANYFGLPAIGARGCGIEDAIEENTTGKLVSGDNEKEITKAIDSIIKNIDDYKKNLPDWIQEHDWNVLVQKFIAAK